MKDIEISERKLEDMVFEILKNPDKYPDKFNFLEHSDIVFRQLNLSNYGIPDIVTISYDIYFGYNVNVYELKKDVVGIDTLIQALRYKQGIRSLLYEFQEENLPINIFLIGSRFDSSNGLFQQISKATTSDNECVRVAEYDIGINGILFTEYITEPLKITTNFNLNKIKSCISYDEHETQYFWYKKIDSCPDEISSILKKIFE